MVYFELKHYQFCISRNRKRPFRYFFDFRRLHSVTNNSVFIGRWLIFVPNNYLVQSSVGKIFFVIVPVLFQCLTLSTSGRNFPFIFNCMEKSVVLCETGFHFEKIDKFLVR